MFITPQASRTSLKKIKHSVPSMRTPSKNRQISLNGLEKYSLPGNKKAWDFILPLEKLRKKMLN